MSARHGRLPVVAVRAITILRTWVRPPWLLSKEICGLKSADTTNNERECRRRKNRAGSGEALRTGI